MYGLPDESAFTSAKHQDMVKPPVSARNESDRLTTKKLSHPLEASLRGRSATQRGKASRGDMWRGRFRFDHRNHL